jgi:cellulose synthase/poly-beta-1,6-N-acetylglucosamine synthase-like glycosyltransferase
LTRAHIPPEVLTAAHERSAARVARNWAAADRLRGEIEAAGWRVVDSGADFRLEPAHPPDVVESDRVRYGRSEAVPSRLEDPAVGIATLVVVATDDIADVVRAVTAARAAAPAGTSIVVVADDPTDAERGLETLEAMPEVELVRTSARLGHAAAINIGIRRSSGPVVIVLDGSIEPTGDVASLLARALEDPGVAVVGAFGLASSDLRRFEEVTAGEAAAIEGYLMAFRRSDAAERGPLDEAFRFYRNLDIWWSLVLRDEGEDTPPRRALVVPDVPLVRHEHRAWEATPPAERDRLSKRNFYRILNRFGWRTDLASGGDPPVA